MQKNSQSYLVVDSLLLSVLFLSGRLAVCLSQEKPTTQVQVVIREWSDTHVCTVNVIQYNRMTHSEVSAFSVSVFAPRLSSGNKIVRMRQTITSLRCPKKQHSPCCTRFRKIS